MFKKCIKITAILLALLMAGALVAQDYFDDEPPPGRRGRRGGLLSRKTLSIGIVGSISLKTDILDEDDNVIESYEDEAKTAHYGLTARIYPFMGGKLGFGVTIIHLQTTEIGLYEMNEFLVDMDFLYRIRVGRRILLNFGLGWSQYLTSYDDGTTSDSEWGKLGFNVKIGGELFLSRNISASIEWKWTHFKYDDYIIGSPYDTITKRDLTVDIGLHYWL